MALARATRVVPTMAGRVGGDRGANDGALLSVFVVWVVAGMPALLHECWQDEEDDSLEFGPVSQRGDGARASMSPKARLLFSLRASSFHEAMQAYQERLGYGDYVPPEGEPDLLYTEAELAAQEAWLRVRRLAGPQ